MTTQLNHDQIRNSELDIIRNKGLKENNALRVYTYLKANERARSRRLPRWIWELLQNAHDASKAHDEPLIVKIKYSPEELVFLHNGSTFKAKQIFNLIYHGSTKADEEEAIGEYGSGFLTTHLLSPEIKVSGQLEDKQWFDFLLTRKSDSPNVLLDLMDKAWDGFKEPLLTQDLSMPDPFTTRFVYPIIGEDAEEAVKAGIETLEQCAAFVVVFNEKFSCIDIDIDIEKCRKTLSFKVITPPELDSSPIQQITVTVCENGNSQDRKYLLAQGEQGTSVTVPLESNRDSWGCLSVGNMPRIFKAFPLVGTESFSYPTVINNSSDFFKPTENRDDVPFGESNDDVNTNNRAVIKEAFRLLVNLLKHAASKRWYYAHQWAEIPAIQHNDEKTREWLRTCIRKDFIKEIHETPVVLTEFNKTLAPIDTWLPLVENDEDATELWSLLNDLREYSGKLSRRDEAKGWCKVIKSWGRANECAVSDLPDVGVIDGRKLAAHIENKCSCLKDLQNLLQENVCAIDWLNRLYRFLRKDNKIDDVIRVNRLVLNQAGEFNFLKYLHQDQDIGEELKDIAELLGWQRIRHQLRDPRLTSLDTEQGADNWDSNYIFEKLHTRIQKQAKPDPGEDFKKASARLFAWVVARKDYSRLQNFPVFAADGKSVLYLSSSNHGSTPPLAPSPAWLEGLEEFNDIFPADRILANDFFKEEHPKEIWEQLDAQGIIRKNIIIRRNEIDFKVLSPDPEVYEDNIREHKAKYPISVTDIVELEKILKEVVYDSRERGYKFWRFLTEWFVNKDIQGLEVVKEKVLCGCGKRHKYYPAAWVMLVRKVNWIRDGTPRHLPEAEHLAKLLQEKGWELSSLNENTNIGKLLKAMNVDQPTLKRLFIPDTVINTAVMLSENPQLARHMEDNEKRHQIEQILDTVGDDLPLVNEAVHDEKFLEEYAKKKKQDLTMQANKSLGLLVEKRVGKILSKEGFNVTSNHRGWDFNMTGHITELKVVQNNSSKTWRVEVKTTLTEENHQEVRMSPPQAKEAVEHGKQYLLCIVPLGQEAPTPENVKEKMLFIENIGDRVEPLCADLDRLEKVRANITSETPTDLELKVGKDNVGVLVKKPLWDREGFSLTDLLERLK